MVQGEEIVRFWKGWWCSNPSGSRPNFFGRQHLTFDKGGKDMVLSEGGCGFERVMGMTDVWGWWAGGDGDRFTEKREVLLR